MSLSSSVPRAGWSGWVEELLVVADELHRAGRLPVRRRPVVWRESFALEPPDQGRNRPSGVGM
jgi:hypothetical protein